MCLKEVQFIEPSLLKTYLRKYTINNSAYSISLALYHAIILFSCYKTNVSEVGMEFSVHEEILRTSDAFCTESWKPSVIMTNGNKRVSHSFLLAWGKVYVMWH